MPVVIDDSAVGRRVVIRFSRSSGGDRPLSDVVGELLRLDEDWAEVRARSGVQRVPRSAIVAARLVAPDRRTILELEAVMAAGWRAAETTELDGWLLRANAGWTRRANSVLPLRTSSLPLPRLLDSVAAFYAERGLRPLIQLPLPARGLIDAELARRCWQIEAPVVVLTRELPPVGGDEGAHPVTISSTLTDAWRAGYHARDGVLTPVAVALLERHQDVGFAHVAQDGRTHGIARATADSGWLGVTALEVSPDARRLGIATALMARLAAWGSAHGARRAYLQVEADNADALALYRGLGYAEHHRYHYRRPPADGTDCAL